MIRALVLRNAKGAIYGFEVEDHGDSIVCAAVSALTLNTVNSIERFCGNIIRCEYNNDGGYMRFIVPSIQAGTHNHDADLLLKSLHLGLTSIQAEYPKEIDVN